MKNAYTVLYWHSNANGYAVGFYGMWFYVGIFGFRKSVPTVKLKICYDDLMYNDYPNITIEVISLGPVDATMNY